MTWAMTASRPRWAIPITTWVMPSSATRPSSFSSIGTSMSTPSPLKVRWPMKVRRK